MKEWTARGAGIYDETGRLIAATGDDGDEANAAEQAEIARRIADLPKLVKALDDIAKGMIASDGPSLDLSPADFRAAMWSWSQKRAKTALAAFKGEETPT